MTAEMTGFDRLASWRRLFRSARCFVMRTLKRRRVEGEVLKASRYPFPKKCHDNAYEYSLHLTIESLQPEIGQKLEIFVPRKFLSDFNPNLRRREIWGTNLYTLDSDLVSVLAHMGLFDPVVGCSPYVLGAKATVEITAPPAHFTSSLHSNLRSRDWSAEGKAAYRVLTLQYILPPNIFPRIEWSLTNDPWYTYELGCIGDCTMDRGEWALNRLRAEVIYFETDTERFELAVDPSAKELLNETTPFPLTAPDAPIPHSSPSSSLHPPGDHPCFNSCARARGFLLDTSAIALPLRLARVRNPFATDLARLRLQASRCHSRPLPWPSPPPSSKAAQPDKAEIKAESKAEESDSDTDTDTDTETKRPAPASVPPDESLQVPCADRHIDVLHRGLSWSEVRWNEQGVIIRGEHFPIRRIKFVPHRHTSFALPDSSVKRGNMK
eukprot:gnl/Trimastix_PCT/2073.p1 GENE.gnl/Trimastix_PCT/2073~~gnl/Trimastix_PCT/2073.p1  ORF type:complete len:438 (+),score=75.99 gnl/Trimastix_PCT/2073:61-1374(+)